MKKALILLFLINCTSVYAADQNFIPYIGGDIGVDFIDYNLDTKMDDDFYSGTINLGARIGKNFGAELFFKHSTKNSLEYIFNYETLELDLYYISYGFNIYGYYTVADNFDFFTSFGVSNYKIHTSLEYTNPYYDETHQETINDISTHLGIGIMYTFPYENFSILGQYKYTPLNTEIIKTISEFSVGFRLNF